MIENPWNLKQMFSWFRKKTGLMGCSISFLLLYLYYIIFHFRVTASSIVSLITAVSIFLGGLLLLYYIAYRWSFPELRNTRLHQTLMTIGRSLLLSSAVSVWFVQSYQLPVKVLTKLDQILSFRILGAKLIDSYAIYFPVITFVGMTMFLGFIVFGFSLMWYHIPKTGLMLSRKKNSNSILIPYAIFLISVTGCIFSTDFLEIGPGQQSVIYYGGTEDYVNYRIMNDDFNFWEDLQQNGGFLYGKNTSGDIQVYLSGTGFYGTLMKLGQDITQIPPDKFLKGTRLLLGLMMAGILTALSLRVKKQYGFLASLIFSTFPAITYWFIGPSTHLIWFYFILFIPFCMSVFLYPQVLDGKLSKKSFLIITLLAEGFVFLRGYTYAPGMILSAAIPVFFYDLHAKRPLRDVFWNGVVICLAGTAAFLLVMTIHFFQLWIYLDSSRQAKDYILNRAIFRSSSGDTNLQTPVEIFQNWLDIRVFYISRRIFAMFPQWQQPLDRLNTFGNLHLFAFINIGICFLLYIAQLFQWIQEALLKKVIDSLFYMAITTLVAMISSWSWFPALGHMSHHYHMNGIMFMIPFGLCLFILTGVLVQTLICWIAITQKKLEQSVDS